MRGFYSLRKRLAVAVAVFGLVALWPAVAIAQADEASEGVLVRVNGDATIAPDVEAGVAVTVRGDLFIEGTVATVVVVDGNVTVSGGDVERLIVVRGTASLENGATVTDQIWLADSTMSNDGSAVVTAEVSEGYGDVAIAAWIIGLLIALGLGILAVVAALLFAAVAPGTARSAGAAISGELGKVLLAGLFLWIGLPIVAAFVAETIVGIPTAIAVWVVLLPAMAFLGYAVTGIWLGNLVVNRGDRPGRPFLAAFVGTVILIATAIVPGLGALVGFVASLLGGSALALMAWRALRGTGTIDAPPPAMAHARAA